MSEFFNPMEVKVKMKRVENSRNGPYYIGNSNMEFETKGTVLLFYPTPDNGRFGTLIVKKYEPPDENQTPDDENVEE